MTDAFEVSEPDTVDAEKKRLIEFQTWFDHFKIIADRKTGSNIIYAENAAEVVNKTYWNTLKTKVKPHLQHKLDHRVDRHKIASIIEISIMYTLPVAHEDEAKRLRLNAELAIVIAKTFIHRWKYKGYELGLFLEMTPTFNAEHISWLTKAHIEGFPIFSNAQAWYAMEQLCIWGGEKWATRIKETHYD